MARSENLLMMVFLLSLGISAQAIAMKKGVLSRAAVRVSASESYNQIIVTTCSRSNQTAGICGPCTNAQFLPLTPGVKSACQTDGQGVCTDYKIGSFPGTFAVPTNFRRNLLSSRLLFRRNAVCATASDALIRFPCNAGVTVTDPGRCCALCAAYPGCTYWTVPLVNTNTTIPGCTLFGPQACNRVVNGKLVTSYRFKEPYITGGMCNFKRDNGLQNFQAASVLNDPHFTGAHGVRYDWNGLPNKNFVLITDEDLQVNMRLSGYYDSKDLEGATVIDGQKVAIRTWIRELYVVWRYEGLTHSLHLIAREGPQAERGEEGTLLDGIFVDGTEFHLRQGESLEDLTSGLTLNFEAWEKAAKYDMDYYSLSIKGLMEANIRVRPANQKRQLPDDAEVHLNFEVKTLVFTPQIHGVLGQTYRDDRDERTAKYSALVKQLNGPIIADGESGKGFLDGGLFDYELTSLEATDAHFNAFDTAATPRQQVAALGSITVIDESPEDGSSR